MLEEETPLVGHMEEDLLWKDKYDQAQKEI